MTQGSENKQPDAPTTARARYEKLKVEREPYLRRARDAAKLTIPALMPEEGNSGSTDFPTPYQSAGAEGVNSLASKLLLALLPPGSSFFRLMLDDATRAKLAASASEEENPVSEIDENLGRIEKAVMDRTEERGWRVSKFDSLKHLLVCGNILEQILPDESIRLHYLNNYVVKRDPVGHVLEIIAVEKIAKVALPPAARALVEENTDDEKNDEGVDVYTRVYRDESMYRVYQEVCGKTVPGSQGSYPLDKLPWMPLRYCKVDGQDYGRGRVEEWMGDFESLESLTASITEGASAMAKILFLVDEAGTTDPKTLQDAANLEFVEGRKEDIDVLQIDKLGDFAVAEKKAAQLEIRLNKAFLVHQTRDAERVTAEEVRAIVAELEQALGGLYSILTQDWQGPAVSRVLFQMQKRREIPRLSEKIIKTQIITGLAALGRTSDYQKLRAFVADTIAELGPQAIEYINVGEYLKLKSTALQLPEGVIRSEADVQATRQQNMQLALMQKLGPQAIKTEGEMAQAQAPQPAPSA